MPCSVFAVDCATDTLICLNCNGLLNVLSAVVMLCQAVGVMGSVDRHTFIRFGLWFLLLGAASVRTQSITGISNDPSGMSALDLWLQVVMKLLDNLEGVSPSTYPKHPVNILSRITVKFGLSAVRFSIDEEAHTSGARFRGRARIRNVWLSSICFGSNRFSVRTKCAPSAN